MTKHGTWAAARQAKLRAEDVRYRVPRGEPGARGRLREEIDRLTAGVEPTVVTDYTPMEDKLFALRRQVLAAREKAIEQTSSRKVCGNPLCPLPGRQFARGLQESMSNWVRRRYCSQTCQGLHTNAKRQAEARRQDEEAPPLCRNPRCPRPGRLIPYEPGMDKSKWRRRAYCSRACANAVLFG